MKRLICKLFGHQYIVDAIEETWCSALMGHVCARCGKVSQERATMGVRVLQLPDCAKDRQT